MFESVGVIRESGFVLSDSLGAKVCAYPVLKGEELNGVMLLFQVNDKNYYTFADKLELSTSPQKLISQFGKGVSYFMVESMLLFDLEENNSISEQYIDAMNIINGSDDDIQALTLGGGNCYTLSVIVDVIGVSWEESTHIEHISYVGYANIPVVICDGKGGGNGGGGGGTYGGGGGGNNNTFDPAQSKDRDDCLNNINTTTLLSMLNMAGDYAFPCESGSIVQNAIDQWCNGSRTAAALQPAYLMSLINDIDEKIEYGELQSKCPCFYKILTDMTQYSSEDGENWLCDIMKEVDTATDFTQKFDVYGEGNVNVGLPNPDIEIGNNTQNFSEYESVIRNAANGTFSSSTMYIHESLCSGNFSINGEKASDLQLAARFIHEMLHSYLAKIIHDNNPNSSTLSYYISNPDYDEDDADSPLLLINPEFMNAVYEAISPGSDVSSIEQHVAFYELLKDFITSSLYEMNGEGEQDDYLYFAHLIMNTSSLTSHPSLDLGDFDINNTELTTNWAKIGGNEAFTFGCND